MTIRNLDALFAPRSLAVIGVSERPGSLGGIVLANLEQAGFAGPIWPVNHRHRTVHGREVFADVPSLPGVPDLAVICTPPRSIPGLIEQLGQKGTRAAIVLSAGLKEPMAEGGPTIEQLVLDAARPHLLRVLGPNCIGLLVPRLGLNASFAPGNAKAGSLAFVTQSGALATAMLDWGAGRQIGFSHFISLGDSADVDFGDVLDYLASDGHTSAILMYVESIKHARKFMSAARAAARVKPVILVKAGRAPEGAKAAASHTGALAGSDAVFDAAVERAGMLRVDTLEALFDAAETLAHPRAWHGERLAIVTNGGGAGVLAADALSLGGGKLAQLSEATLAKLDAALPPTWSKGNPVDIIGDAPVERYTHSLRVLLDAPEVDGVLFMHAPTAIVPAADIAGACAPVVKNASKPVLSCWVGGVAVGGGYKVFAQNGLPCFRTPERAVSAWLQLQDYHRHQQALLELPDAPPEAVQPDRRAARALVRGALAEGREWLDEAQAKALLAAYGIPTVQTVTARDAGEAADAAVRIGFPVALKVLSPQVLHKSDVGGVVLDLQSHEEVRQAAVRMLERVTREVPGAQMGYTVQAMARRPGAHELIVGIASDPAFGPVILFGHGGTAVELRNDRAVGLPPLNANLAESLISRTRIAPLLAGYRGRPPVQREALVDALLKVSELACDIAEVAELDINPLLADSHGVLALDARIRVRCATGGSRLALRPYPSGLEESVALDGHTLKLRPIRPEDGARLTAFYAQAAPGDMRMRFFHVRRDIPAAEVARYTLIDYEREMAFVALDGDRIVGEARALCDPDNTTAEFATQIAGDWQHKGLGSKLLAKTLDYLRERGTGELVAYTLRENDGMLALGREIGCTVKSGPEDLVTMTLKLR
ncbi:bifunctional acetate--CoA ligase family protein/GNAT family N-acetyltransferase [Ramlibacter albus]|uniref:Bifunctional acetate--CoA ligase family protein/GNAT family N-acetyltransferase n=1 Tax=Ramlibacter albus TaxID=2079448 RepID=A0A923M3M6_9BURK|nr:bifunctional acetate--CoA ligase family protein/GNAT family N-acetyltransferase [Ramlibacter albus]MBC5763335.1 bifunctional acetate--CoA ligase family protein/GNAT family N-acetyltransferase [Ramlibacter albus]